MRYNPNVSVVENAKSNNGLLKQSTYASSVRGASQSTTPSGDRLQLRNPPESNRQDDVLHPSFHGEYGR